MADPLYSVEQCKTRIREINAQLQKLEDAPQMQSVGPYSVMLQGKMADLRKERRWWEVQLHKAKANESGGNGINGKATIQ